MSLRVGSLFSGIGGLDLGLERAGMEIAWQSEIDGFCNRVLSHHWPGVTNHGDITRIDPADLQPVDLVCGGFPCQDLSVAGSRAGLAGARSGLWWEFHRILAGLRPRWVVIENVPGLLSSNGGRDMGTLLRSLGDLGYGWAYSILDAQWFGLAQRRKRVFIVGRLGDAAGPAQVLFEPESREWNPPPRREAGKVAATIPASGAGTSRTGNERTEADLLVEVAATLNSAGNSGGFRTEPGEHLVPVRKAARAREKDGEESWVEADTANTLNTWDHGDIRSTNLVAHTLRVEGHDASEDGTGRELPMVWESRYARNGRGAPAEIAPALRAENGRTGKGDGAPLVGVRRLTPLECERLQGFPDGWTCLCDAKGDTMRCTCPDSPRYRALGNAVAVPVAEWIGRRILAVEATNNARAEAR